MTSLLLALLPVIAIVLLLTLRKSAADTAGMIGWLVAAAVAWLYFGTAPEIVLRATVAGVLASLPISLMVAASIFQVTLMLETGAIARVVVLIKQIAPGHQVAQIMLINMGFGTILAALGATPVSILPPIMVALGYSSFVSIALPAIGYDALCTYALLGVPVVVFSNFVGRPVQEVSWYFARYMPVISSAIGLGMLFVVGRWALVAKGFVPALTAGLVAGFVAIGMTAIGLVPITGVVAGVAVILAMLGYLKLTGHPIIDRSKVSADDRATERRQPLWVALSPWIILSCLAIVGNAPILPIYDWTFNQLAMPVSVIPKAPPERLRVFAQAYFWILVATALSLPFLKPSRAQLAASARKWLKRAPRPTWSAAVFFAIAYVINHSGKAADGAFAETGANMVKVVAGAAASGLGSFYPLVAPFLGLLAGFISGSEASAIAMLTGLHLSAAAQIGAAGLLIAAASGIGGGLASVISPAKLQNAAASIDRIGEESRVIGTVFWISISITAVCAVMTLLWAF
jgi:lactate permease